MVSFGNYWSSCLEVRLMIFLSFFITVIEIFGRGVTFSLVKLFVSKTNCFCFIEIDIDAHMSVMTDEIQGGLVS